MAIEVHTGHKPARRHAALVCSVLWLAAALLLAQGVVGARSGEPLGERIHHDGWPISFRAPAQFDHFPPDPDRGEHLHQFAGPRGILHVGPAAIEAGTDAEDVCLEVWRVSVPSFPRGQEIEGPRQRAIGLLGVEGFEIQDRAAGLAVRAVVLDPEHAYVVLARSKRGPLTRSLLRRFRVVCDSVEWSAKP